MSDCISDIITDLTNDYCSVFTLVRVWTDVVYRRPPTFKSIIQFPSAVIFLYSLKIGKISEHWKDLYQRSSNKINISKRTVIQHRHLKGLERLTVFFLSQCPGYCWWVWLVVVDLEDLD